jgi:hypothetical protein
VHLTPDCCRASWVSGTCSSYYSIGRVCGLVVYCMYSLYPIRRCTVLYCTVRYHSYKFVVVCCVVSCLRLSKVGRLHAFICTPPEFRLALHGHNNKNILFFCYKYSLLVLALVILQLPGRSRSPFRSEPSPDCCLHSILRFVPRTGHQIYSVRTSASLMTPRTTSVSSSVPFSSLGRCACGGWGVSR